MQKSNLNLLEWRVAVVLLFSLFGGFLSASSRLDFPRISFDPEIIVGIAVFNPNPDDATATLTAFGADGQVLTLPERPNPQQVTLPAGRQFAGTIQELLGGGVPTETVAWLRLQSSADDLTGFFLFLNSDFSLFDGADLPEPSSRILFDQVRLNGGFTTELNLVNPNSAAVSAQLSLMGKEGLIPSGAGEPSRVEIPGRGLLRVDIADFFGIQETEDQVSLVADGNSLPLLGYAMVQGEQDFFGLNARPVDRLLNRLFIPQLAVLDPFLTQLILNNTAEEPVVVDIFAYQPNGELYAPPRVTRNPVQEILEPGEVRPFELVTTFGFSGNSPLEGWIEVSAASLQVNGLINYAIPSNGSQAAVSSLVRGSTRAVFSHIATTAGFFTGVAILNPSALVANVRITAYRTDGSLLGTFVTVLQPGQRISRLIDEFIPEAAGQAGGMILVRSDVPLFLTSLFGNLESGVLANIPPQPVPPAFAPDATLPAVRLLPPFAVIEPFSEIDFALNMPLEGNFWNVNGAGNGNDEVGMVDAAGTYRAPSSVPSSLPITVGTETDLLAAAATVDVLEASTFSEATGELLSVTHLSQLNRVFTAEFTSSGGAAQSVDGSGIGSDFTRIVAIDNGERNELLQIPDLVPKLLPFTGTDSKEYLLALTEEGGQVLRIDPLSGTSAPVVSGLILPNTMALDSVTRDLLVVDADGIRRFTAETVSGTGSAGTPQTRLRTLQGFVDPGAVAVDDCTGRFYVAEPDTGDITEVDPNTNNRRVVANLSSPSVLVGLYREAVSCPDGFQLVAATDDGISLIVPARDLVIPWLPLEGVTDFSFLPETAPSGPGVLIAQSLFGETTLENTLLLVETAGLYRRSPDNVQTIRPAIETFRLTSSPLHDQFPAWDPGSETIAYIVPVPPNNGVPFDIGSVQADGSGEGLLVDGPDLGFGVGHSLTWLGNSGQLVTNERVVFHEYGAFNVSAGPVVHANNDGTSGAFTRLLVVPGGGGGEAIRISRDGSTAAWRVSSSGGCGATEVRVAPVSSLNEDPANMVGNVLLNGICDPGDPLLFVQGMSLSPDGSRLAISVPNGNGFDLQILDTVGSLPPVQLTTSGGSEGRLNLHPAFSPDGTEIAFTFASGGIADLYLIDDDGSNLRPILQNNINEQFPTWSPDGLRLAYMRLDTELEGEPDNWNIYVLRLP